MARRQIEKTDGKDRQVVVDQLRQMCRDKDLGQNTDNSTVECGLFLERVSMSANAPSSGT